MARPPLTDLTNRRFGRLIALEYAGDRRWRCRCDCGAITIVWRVSLRNKTSQSCGCLQREQLVARRVSHGASRLGRVTPEYHTWRGLKARCLVPTSPQWKNYGGRGITVCDAWRDSFEAFLADMGPRPSPRFSLDRVDNNGPYAPENCRWALAATQNGNKRTNRLLTFRGKTQHLAAWARDLNIPAAQVRAYMAAPPVTHDVTREPRQTREYTAWCLMKGRCLNPTNPRWKDYGGRGIAVCDRWRDSFAAFLADMGPRPAGRFSLDRIDNNGPYTPENCRWALMATQAVNKRTTHLLTFRGKTQHLAAWARDLGIPIHQIHNRLRRGWSVHRTLTEPTFR